MLRLENITKTYGEKTLFRDFSYTFPDTGIYAITGNSGAGKTTLARIICGLERDFSGEVLGGGIENTSVCFQEHRLFPTLTAIQNIAMVSFPKHDKYNDEAALSILLRLCFSESDAKLYPKELSGGMRQRVAFARAVLRNTPILILDEATKELDDTVRAEVISIIKEESKKRLVLIISHSESEICELGAMKVHIGSN